MSTLLTALKKNSLVQRLYRKAGFHLASRSLSGLAPIVVRRSSHDGRRLNLVIPTVRSAHIFGGIATALTLFDALRGELGGEVPCRIILTEYPTEGGDLARFDGFEVVPWDEDRPSPRQIVACRFRTGRTIPVMAGDVFLATQWTTAYLAQQIVREQAILYGRKPHHLGYLIQDFEPGFYPYSSEYLLCESTYRSSLPQVAVFNSSFLADYFRSHGYSFSREFQFEPRLNSRLRAQLLSGSVPTKRKLILIYGRPSTPRNAFPLLVEGLRAWAGPDWREWELLSAGEAHPDVALGHGLTLRSVGKVTLDDYARLLGKAAVGVSLMVSPHPSYPPLEMAHFGVLIVTNGFAPKELSAWHDNIVSLDICTPATLGEAIAGQCRRFLDDPSAGFGGRSRVPGYLDDGPAFDFLPELAQALFPEENT